MDLSVPDREFGLAQPHAAAALMKSASDAEFVAVPGADDVALGFVIGLRPRGLVPRHRLKHAFHDAALADRAGTVRASVMPGVEFIPDPEHADFLVPAHHDLATAVGVIVDAACHVLGHPPPPISFCRARAELPVAGPATADQHRYLECHHRRRLVEPPILYLDGAIAGGDREQA